MRTPLTEIVGVCKRCGQTVVPCRRALDHRTFVVHNWPCTITPRLDTDLAPRGVPADGCCAQGTIDCDAPAEIVDVVVGNVL